MSCSLNLGAFVDAFSGVGRVVDGGKRGVFVELGEVFFLSKQRPLGQSSLLHDLTTS